MLRLTIGRTSQRAGATSFRDGAARLLYDPQTIGEEQLAALTATPGYRVLERQ
jgi:hypothetical protein